MTAAEETLPNDTRLGRARLLVDDFRSVGEFYADVIGLEVLDRSETDATLGVDGVPLLELHSGEPFGPRRPEKAGLFHIAFRVPSRQALGEALQRIETLWELDGASDHKVSEALYLSDPEGNGVEIYRDRPREAWPVESDGSVRMDTLPLDVEDIRETDEWVDRVPTGTDIGHVHLEVSDMDRAREFYVDTLGLRVRQTFEDMGLFLAADEYHHHVGLNTWKGRSEPAGSRGIDWFELVVPEASAVEAVRDRMRASGIEVTDQGEAIVARDPDSIGVRLRPETAAGF